MYLTGKEFIKEIKGVFIPPIKRTYFGKVAHGCPYFYPRNYCGSIFRTRIVDKDYNAPYYGRCKKLFQFNLFKKRIELYVGYPVKIVTQHLGWKDKWETPRYEWSPAFHIYFFGLQYYHTWVAPATTYSDTYWEMALWWMYYSNKDIHVAEKTWGWRDGLTKKSTWDKKYLI